MEKKLPGIFANQIAKDMNNNNKIYYSKAEETPSSNREAGMDTHKEKLGTDLNINQKINKIFNSTKYVYKADVRITLKDNSIDCRIIGRNPTHLITIDNKLIPISDITDISFLE